MRLGEKLARLREAAGRRRGLDRPLSKVEVSRLMRAELGTGVSHAYLSQLELGRRVHLSAHTRDRLARFFGVHPGYLVDDPPGTDANGAEVPAGLDGFSNWSASPFAFRAEPALERIAAKLANVAEPGRYLALFERLLELPIEASEATLRRQERRANGAPGGG